MEFNIKRSHIEEAHDRIRPFIHRTPVMTSASLDEMAGCSLYFKCENFQKIGAFKARGGLNAVMTLTASQKSKGVVTHSSGNHAQAVALAAKQAGIPAYIVMPRTAPKIKQKGVKALDAEITLCEPTLEAREKGADEIMQKTGATFISPYDNDAVIAGQASCGKELLEDYPELDQIITPVGGGGLLAGTLLSALYLKPEVEVFAGEPEGAKDTYLSFKSGVHQKVAKPETIADGLLAYMGDKNFAIIKPLLKDVFLVSDDEIIAAMRLIWERMKIIIEPSCAVPFAALLKNKDVFAGKKVGVVLTGGNVDLDHLPF